MFSQVARNLLKFPKEHPVIFGVGFSCAKTSFADWLVQKYIEGRKQIDIPRNLTFAAFGLFYLGGVQYFIYVPFFRRLFPYATTWSMKSLGDRLRDRLGLWTMTKQVFLDQCIHHPFLYFPAFYMTKALVTGTSCTASLRNYRENFFTDLFALWKIWIPATIINFTVSPFWLRIPFVASTSLFWTCILSAMRGSTETIDDVDKTEESFELVGHQGRAISHVYTHDNPYNIHFIVTATGTDRMDLLSDLSRIISHNGGNIFQSRMSRLGGEFALIMLVGVDKAHHSKLTSALAEITDISLQTRETHHPNLSSDTSSYYTGDFSFKTIDQPGLVHQLMDCFLKHELRINSMKTEASHAEEHLSESLPLPSLSRLSVSAETEPSPHPPLKPIFLMKGTFTAPEQLAADSLYADLDLIKANLHPSTHLKVSLQKRIAEE